MLYYFLFHYPVIFYTLNFFLILKSTIGPISLNIYNGFEVIRLSYSRAKNHRIASIVAINKWPRMNSQELRKFDSLIIFDCSDNLWRFLHFCKFWIFPPCPMSTQCATQKNHAGQSIFLQWVQRPFWMGLRFWFLKILQNYFQKKKKAVKIKVC